MDSQNKDKFNKIFNKTNSILDEKQKSELMNFIETTDFPTLKTELWKHTNIKPLLEPEYQIAESFETSLSEAFVKQYFNSGEHANTIIMCNGVFSNRLSVVTDKNLSVSDTRVAKIRFPEEIAKHYNSIKVAEQNIFSAYNTLFADNGFFIKVNKGKVIEQPIYIINLIDNSKSDHIAQPHNLIVVGENSNLKIVELFLNFNIKNIDYTNNSLFKALNNSFTEVYLAENTVVEYNRLQSENEFTYHINSLNVKQKQNSVFTANTFSFDGAFIRNEIKVEHEAENCETNLNGLYLPTNNQLFDNYLFVHHKKPNSQSKQLYKGILNHKAQSVFLGRVYVDKDAQKTNAFQSNKNILLTNEAKASSKPQLEIYADDVKCSHGSSTGQFDTEQMFYMQSRGISKSSAHKLLLQAYTKEVINKISVEDFRSWLELKLDQVFSSY